MDSFEGGRSSAEQCLDALLGRAGKPVDSKNVHFCKGESAKTILDYVESLQPDVLVMGTVDHTDVCGLLIGNTADNVLRQIACPVLAVKPDNLFHA